MEFVPAAKGFKGRRQDNSRARLREKKPFTPTFRRRGEAGNINVFFSILRAGGGRRGASRGWWWDSEVGLRGGPRRDLNFFARRARFHFCQVGGQGIYFPFSLSPILFKRGTRAEASNAVAGDLPGTFNRGKEVFGDGRCESCWAAGGGNAVGGTAAWSVSWISGDPGIFPNPSIVVALTIRCWGSVAREERRRGERGGEEGYAPVAKFHKRKGDQKGRSTHTGVFPFGGGTTKTFLFGHFSGHFSTKLNWSSLRIIVKNDPENFKGRHVEHPRTSPLKTKKMGRKKK